MPYHRFNFQSENSEFLCGLTVGVAWDEHLLQLLLDLDQLVRCKPPPPLSCLRLRLLRLLRLLQLLHLLQLHGALLLPL